MSARSSNALTTRSTRLKPVRRCRRHPVWSSNNGNSRNAERELANRRHDWTDIAGIVVRQDALDWGEIVSRLSPLAELKGEPAILLKLEQVRAEATTGQ